MVSKRSLAKRGAGNKSVPTVPVGTKAGRIGTKRGDFRYRDENGEEWDSRFEPLVFKALKEAGYNVRRTTAEDTLDYTTPVRGAFCRECDTCEVVKRRQYTPDFVTDSSQPGLPDKRVHYVEAKGYLRADRRALLRYFVRSRPDIDLSLVVQRDYRVSAKRSICQWARDLAGIPCYVLGKNKLENLK